jgi:hypothetical protein
VSTGRTGPPPRRRIGPSPTRALILLAALAAAWFYLRTQVRREAALEAGRGAPAATVSVGFAAAPRDLATDEAAGGHTLARHVGASDAGLARRLADEPNLAVASTFVDRATAERAVAAALDGARARIERWLRSPGDETLALRWPGDGRPLGRLLERGADTAVDASAANVVLRRRGGGYNVLTADTERARPMERPSP